MLLVLSRASRAGSLVEADDSFLETSITEDVMAVVNVRGAGHERRP
jgi:hypothetical protein